MPLQRRKGAKLQMKCNQCRGACGPQEGDWHETATGQIFLCRHCEVARRPVKAGPRTWSFEFRRQPGA